MMRDDLSFLWAIGQMEGLGQLNSMTQLDSMDLQTLLVRFAISAALGCLISSVFRISKPPVSARDDQAMFTTLVLLTVLICMVTTVVGNSIARAFSLAGALAIVRFRTVVEDTRDTAFVVFAVVVGMAIGCGHWEVTLAGVPIVSAAAIGLRWIAPRRSPFDPGTGGRVQPVRLRLRSTPGVDVTSLLNTRMPEVAKTWRCTEVETVKQGTVIESTYRVELLPTVDLMQWVHQLNLLEGIQSASLLRMDVG